MIKHFFLILCLLITISCNDLDLYPLSQGASENWFNDEVELTMAVRSLYSLNSWNLDSDDNTDDWTERNLVTEVTGGTMSDKSSLSKSLWDNCYRTVSKTNFILENLDKAQSNGISPSLVERCKAETLLVRAYQYGRLISHFGDVPFITNTLTIEEAKRKTRTDKKVILQHIYMDLDEAAKILEVSYPQEQRATKGLAYAVKARIALYMQDWETARKSAWDCMNLGIYQLEPKYEKLFDVKTKESKEFIFIRPRSKAMGTNTLFVTRDYLSRNAKGYTLATPSWDLFFSYLCTDGKTIDKSPLFNPKKPFENRDPRCSKTIVPFNSEHLGYNYDPHPYSETTLEISTGKQVANRDNRVIDQYGSYNGLIWKKGVDKSWTENAFRVEKNEIIMRYADVLLMYAEAKIELNDIDDSVLDAMNIVRARAYEVDKGEINKYPKITTVDQHELRKILRIERRMEFALEGLRYMDIIRWRIAENVLNRNIYGLLDPSELIPKIVEKDLWFFPETPNIDDSGCPNLDPIGEKGLIKILANRSFDKQRQYLWPIPYQDVQNSNGLIENNPNY